MGFRFCGSWLHSHAISRQVYPSCLVYIETDYSALSKRYPKLSISPEFTKLVLHRPKGNLNLSLHTPVRFKHDLIEVDAREEPIELSAEPLVEEPGSPKCRSTVWNSKRDQTYW